LMVNLRSDDGALRWKAKDRRCDISPLSKDG
jgi:hypothetical protein